MSKACCVNGGNCSIRASKGEAWLFSSFILPRHFFLSFFLKDRVNAGVSVQLQTCVDITSFYLVSQSMIYTLQLEQSSLRLPASFRYSSSGSSLVSEQLSLSFSTERNWAGSSDPWLSSTIPKQPAFFFWNSFPQEILLLNGDTIFLLIRHSILKLVLAVREYVLL